jgi:hypothetical protein
MERRGRFEPAVLHATASDNPHCEAGRDEYQRPAFNLEPRRVRRPGNVSDEQIKHSKTECQCDHDCREFNGLPPRIGCNLRIAAQSEHERSRRHSSKRYRLAGRDAEPAIALSTDVIVGFRNPYVEPVDSQTLQQKLDLLRMYADNVIAKQ